jgi:hypothetical protein
MGHIEDTRQSWNSNFGIAKEIHIGQFGRTNIDFIDRYNALDRQQKTF